VNALYSRVLAARLLKARLLLCGTQHPDQAAEPHEIV
jgi:hypothetical protein